MKIVNGKWQDDNQCAVDNFNVSQLLEIGKNVTSLYGEKITYDRIDLVSSILKLDGEDERSLAYLLEQKQGISKLVGY